MNMRKTKPFIYSDKFSGDYTMLIVFYGVFTAVIISFCIWGNARVAPMALIIYAVSTQLGGYFFMYKAIRDFTIYLICFGFAVIHVLLYFLFKGNPNLEMVRGNPSPMLIDSIILLVLFQILRYLSLKIQKREFVVPSRGGGKDLFDNIAPSATDYTLFVIYFASWYGLAYLA